MIFRFDTDTERIECIGCQQTYFVFDQIFNQHAVKLFLYRCNICSYLSILYIVDKLQIYLFYVVHELAYR